MSGRRAIAVSLCAVLISCVRVGNGDIACERDEQCPVGTICGSSNRCVAGVAADAGPASMDAGSTDGGPLCGVVPGCIPSNGAGCAVECPAGFVCTLSGECEQPRYTVSDAGTALDNVTGLVWQTGTPAVQCGDGDGYCTWADAEAYCTHLQLGGYESGWVLPTVQQLFSLFDQTRQVDTPAIDSTTFQSSSELLYWTSSMVTGEAGTAWYIDFGGDGVLAAAVTPGDTASARCVQGPAASDAGTDDAGVDDGGDAGLTDAGVFDGGMPDAGPDGGVTDGGQTASCPTTTGKWVDGYYVDYEQGLYPPADIDWCGLTHIMISHVMPNTDGSLDLTPDGYDVGTLAATLVTAAHAHGRKALMHVGGAGSEPGFNGATAGATATPPAAPFTTFKTNLESLVDSTGADGLDFDWEPLDSISGNSNAASDEAALLALVTALRNDKPALLMTVSIPWVNGNYELNGESIDQIYEDLVPYVDQFNIQTYRMFYADQTTAVSGWESWYTAPLYYPPPGSDQYSQTPGSIDSSVQAYLGAGVPAASLGVGVPFFGECWQDGITGPDQTITSTSQLNPNDDNVMTYAAIATYYYAATAARYDSDAGEPYLTFATPPAPPTATGLPSTCTFISYDDPQSIAAKGAYVKSQGLGGAIVWTINQGYLGTEPDPPPTAQQDPLMKALYTSFLQ